jgi:hypothetical protein
MFYQFCLHLNNLFCVLRPLLALLRKRLFSLLYLGRALPASVAQDIGQLHCLNRGWCFYFHRSPRPLLTKMEKGRAVFQPALLVVGI